MLAPPSKSAAHRLLIASALAEQPTLLTLIEESEDTQATRECLQALGARCQRQGELLEITPIGGGIADAELDCGESGSTLRFLLPVAAAWVMSPSMLLPNPLPLGTTSTYTVPTSCAMRVVLSN